MVGGREGYPVLSNSGDPDIQEVEPEVRLLGGHHGDEMTSIEVPLYISEFLTREYGEDPEITEIVDEREVWIVPVVNQDELVYFSRYNANWVDLNRNYSYMWRSSEFLSGEYTFSELEIKAIINFSLFNPFLISIYFHSGATLINHVWNYTYDPTPDEPTIEVISQEYSKLCETSVFYVRNGANWYITLGDTNDWSYWVHGDIDWTIEVSNLRDIPPESRFCEEHQDSVLFVIHSAGRMGIHGIVEDLERGLPPI